MKVVMAGLTESDGSKRALRWAASRAADLGAELRVVTVIPLPLPVGSPTVPGACLPDMTRLREAGLAVQRSLVDESIGGMPWVRILHVVDVGDPVRILPRLASDADLLVLGRSGRRRFRSLTARCRRHATCPVVEVTAEGSPW